MPGRGTGDLCDPAAHAIGSTRGATTPSPSPPSPARQGHVRTLQLGQFIIAQKVAEKSGEISRKRLRQLRNWPGSRVTWPNRRLALPSFCGEGATRCQRGQSGERRPPASLPFERRSHMAPPLKSIHRIDLPCGMPRSPDETASPVSLPLKVTERRLLARGPGAARHRPTRGRASC